MLRIERLNFDHLGRLFRQHLGHYLAARWRGVHVEAFSIGFGRPLLKGTDRHGTEWFGHQIDLHVHRWQPDVVTALLADAGLVVRASLVREPDDDGVEIGPRAFLLAQRS